MKIIDLRNQILNALGKDIETNKIVELLKNNQLEMHVSDLDLVLLLISLGEINSISIEQLDILCDSEFASVLAPNSYLEEKESKIREEIFNNLKDKKIDNKTLEIINNHELINEVNIESLTISKEIGKDLNYNVNIEVKTSGQYSFALSQASYKFLYNIILTNNSNVPLTNLVLKITSIPNYVTFSDINIPHLNPKQPIIINDFVFTPILSRMLCKF